ncbi:MAG TPA: hypothetical protein VFL69_10790 [Marmoricola sp.]|nr:hypothetical protein [Marmoricola sp.]
MLFAVGILGLAVLAFPVFFIMTLRRWELDEARVEERLHAPDAHKVSYVVPEGQDPAILRAALTHAGFVSVLDESGGTERLVVECASQDRSRVREIIEHVERSGFEGIEMHAGHVRFDQDG